MGMCFRMLAGMNGPKLLHLCSTLAFNQAAKCQPWCILLVTNPDKQLCCLSLENTLSSISMKLNLASTVFYKQFVGGK